MIVNGMVNVNNMPEYRKKYLVATLVDGELWFYGMYDEDEKSRAEMALRENDNRIMVEVQKDECGSENGN